MSDKRRVKKLKKALQRSNTRLLLSAVMIFQFAACALLALKTSPIDAQAAIFAFALPLATWLISTQITRLWPVDRALVILALLLCSIGIIALQDIAKSPSTPLTQARYVGLGVIALLIGAHLARAFKPRKRRAPWIMALALIILLTPWVLGEWKLGARNWINLFNGAFSLQPSELMKPIFVIALALGFSNRPRFLKCLPTLAFAAACCAILLSQRDLGALLLYFLTTVIMYFAATSNAAISLSGLGLGAGAAVIAYKAFPYVQKRVEMWINPWSDPSDSGYQIIQALIAIGSGGLFGMGLGQGSPRDIPLYHSDFIFAALTEEFGLIFSVGVLLIYVMLITRGMLAAMNARTSFRSLAAFGVVTMIAMQTMLIVGGNTKLLPLTGVTLPLISAGGSSVVSTMFSIGILAGISSINAQDEARDIEKLEAIAVGNGE